MQQIQVSAPAKLFILGEHAVVYDGKAIVTAVDARLYVEITYQPSRQDMVYIEAPDVGLDNWSASLEDILSKETFEGESRFIEACIVAIAEHYTLSGELRIRTRSDFDKNLGLGSSSATVAATLFALAQIAAPTITPMQLFDMGLAAILKAQGKIGSGADLAAAIFGGTIYYENKTPRKINPIELQDLPIVAVYSGQKAGTTSYVKQVAALRNEHTQIVDSIIQNMLVIVDHGYEAIQKRDWLSLGRLMNIQHGLLHAIGVDTSALSEVVFAARSANSYGAKLSGAGGGDCAVVLIENDKRTVLEEQLKHIGREILPFQLHAEGVKKE